MNRILRYRCNGLVLLMFLGIAVNLSAQDPVHERFSNSDLPVPYFTLVNSLADGRLAFASWAGLTVYDGTNFKNYSMVNGLPQLDIQATFLDNKGRLWIHTSAGLSCLENDSIFNLDLINPKIRGMIPIRQFLVGLNDTIYFTANDAKGGFHEVKIYKSKLHSKKWDRIKIKQNENIVFRDTKHPEKKRAQFYYSFDFKQDFFIGHVIFNKDTLIVKSKLTNKYEEISGEASNFDNRVLIFLQKQVFITTEKGIVCNYKFEDIIFNSRLIGNELWVWFKHGGVAYVKDYRTGEKPIHIFTDVKLYDRIWSMNKDFAGGYWFLTGSAQGVIYVPDLESLQLKKGKELQGELSSTYVHDQEAIFGYFDGSLGVIDMRTFKERRIDLGNYQLSIINHITQYDGAYYISSNRGVVRLEKDLRSIRIISNYPGHTWFKHNDELWVGNGRFGASIIKGTEAKQVKLNVKNSLGKVIKMYKSNQDTLLSSTTGIYRIHNGDFFPISKDPFFNTEAYHYSFEKGLSAYCSYGSGMKLIHKNDTVTLNSESGLASDIVHIIYQDKKGNLWVGTTKGINKISVKRGIKHLEIGQRSFVNYDINNFFELNGKVWACDGEGCYVVSTSHNGTSYPLKLIEVKTEGELRSNGYYLAQDANQIGFSFRAICFDKRISFNYEYRLIGYDKAWSTTDENNVNFKGLPSGNYAFTVRIKGGTEQLKPIHFTVATPFYATWWFYLLIFLVILAITILVVRYYVKQKTVAARLIAYELKALRSQMNPHFTFNSLNSIQRYVLVNKPEEAIEFIHKYSRLVRLILNNSAQEYVNLSEELEALELYLKIEQNRTDNKFQYSIELEDDLDVDYYKIPSMILQPYIENAIWHGVSNKKETGTIKLCMHKSGNYLICSIEDDGVGRKRAKELKSKYNTEKKSFGLTLSEDRLRLLNRSTNKSMKVELIDLYDAAGNACGTKVLLKLKIEE